MVEIIHYKPFTKKESLLVNASDLYTQLWVALTESVYLVFNEGYSASSGDSLVRSDLSAEAIRLGRLLVELLPEAEAVGLLALMLLKGRSPR